MISQAFADLHSETCEGNQCIGRALVIELFADFGGASYALRAADLPHEDSFSWLFETTARLRRRPRPDVGPR